MPTGWKSVEKEIARMTVELPTLKEDLPDIPQSQKSLSYHLSRPLYCSLPSHLFSQLPLFLFKMVRFARSYLTIPSKIHRGQHFSSLLMVYCLSDLRPSSKPPSRKQDLARRQLQNFSDFAISYPWRRFTKTHSNLQIHNRQYFNLEYVI